MNDDLKEQTIQARVDELLSGEFDPWTHDHILEAISQTDSIVFTASVAVAHQLPGNPLSEDALIKQTLKTVEDYWKYTARYTAEREFDGRRRDCEDD